MESRIHFGGFIIRVRGCRREWIGHHRPWIRHGRLTPHSRACCGVTAWKPTYGAVSALGAMPLAPTLDTIGLLARSASDMSTAARVLYESRHDEPIGRIAVLIDAVERADRSIANACLDGIDAI